MKTIIGAPRVYINKHNKTEYNEKYKNANSTNRER